MFGRMFNDIDVVRYKDGAAQQIIRVPIAYGPTEKWLSKLSQDATLSRQVAIQLPRLSFEMTSMTYDPNRALNKMKRSFVSADNNNSKYLYSPVPYNFNITLSGMFAYQEDAVQVTEQIIPFFRPEWTMSLNLMDTFKDYYDIPTVLQSMAIEDSYEGDYESRRAIIYTWDFVVKGYLFGPDRTKGIIKRTITDININAQDQSIGTLVDPSKQITLTPGLTIDGDPTTNPIDSVNTDNINVIDNWGYAFDSEDFFGDYDTTLFEPTFYNWDSDSITFDSSETMDRA